MKYGFLVLLLVFSSFVLAQSTNATISGGVTDSAGNFIVNADIEIANDATGIVYSASTNRVRMYLCPDFASRPLSRAGVKALDSKRSHQG